MLIGMGVNKNLYVSDRDMELWQWTERYAYENRHAVNAVVMMALERFRAEVEPAGEAPE